jgi:hypothetical protein
MGSRRKRRRFERYPAAPGSLDAALWWVGRSWCDAERPCRKDCASAIVVHMRLHHSHAVNQNTHAPSDEGLRAAQLVSGAKLIDTG